MKIMTVLGTRPEIIRLSRIIAKLDKLCQQILINTGQNHDMNLNDIFFQNLCVRQPNHMLDVRGNTIGEQIGKILVAAERIILIEKPDRVLVLGDTNSSLIAIIAKRMGIPVYHMEAGNRCYDDCVPEEINRRIIDHCSDVLMPYTERSRANLLREGIEGHRIFVTGNPIYEVIDYYSEHINVSKIMEKLNIKEQEYFLVTAHRAENVDDINHLKNLFTGMDEISKKYSLPIIYSLHPHTKNRIEKFNLKPNGDIRFFEPFGFFDFITLEKNARCVISDSGTVQEECSIFKVPNITIRDTTERPETIESGSSILAGISPDSMLRAVDIALSEVCDWEPPIGYLGKNVSSIVVKIILGYLKNTGLS